MDNASMVLFDVARDHDDADLMALVWLWEPNFCLSRPESLVDFGSRRFSAGVRYAHAAFLSAETKALEGGDAGGQRRGPYPTYNTDRHLPLHNSLVCVRLLYIFLTRR